MRSILHSALACAFILGTGYSRASDAPHQDTAVIDLQGEAFKALRDPFWPVDYKPVSESEKIENTKIADLKAKINWPTLQLRGVTHAGGRNYIAIIDGVGLVVAGDIVVIEQDSLIYRWRIDKVTSVGVSSTRLDVTEKVGN
jgi:hypothetical protein